MKDLTCQEFQILDAALDETIFRLTEKRRNLAHLPKDEQEHHEVFLAKQVRTVRTLRLKVASNALETASKRFSRLRVEYQAHG